MASIEETFEKIAASIKELSSKVDRLSLSNHGYNIKNSGFTVGPTGKSFTSIQAAINMLNGSIITDSDIVVDPGVYTENILIRNLITPTVHDLIIWGDTRSFVGITMMSGFPLNIDGVVNLGSGTCTLSNATVTITVTGSISNPNFTAVGLVAGDIVIIRDSTGAMYERVVNTVGTNTFTVTVVLRS